jgi:hypothetical protein
VPYIDILAGVTGVARDDKLRNLIASVFIIEEKKGLNNLWKSVAVQYAPCYQRKEGSSTYAERTHVQGKEDSIANEYNVLFDN